MPYVGKKIPDYHFTKGQYNLFFKKTIPSNKIISTFAMMRKVVAVILLLVHLGFSFFPNLLFLGVQLISGFTIEYQEEKIPCLKSTETPMTGDFAYLFALQKSADCERSKKKDSNIPINHFDTSNIYYFLPSTIKFNFQEEQLTNVFLYRDSIEPLYYDVFTPPPKTDLC